MKDRLSEAEFAKTFVDTLYANDEREMTVELNDGRLVFLHWSTVKPYGKKKLCTATTTEKAQAHQQILSFNAARNTKGSG